MPLLPIFAGLSALRSLAGGASAVAKVITDSKNAKKNLAEIKGHNLAMEGKGMYLQPYKGRGKKNKELNIPFFRGVFMRDGLPKQTRKYESAILNLDSKYGEDKHWVCYRKRGNRVEYFDSFCNLTPPRELLQYLGSGVTVNYKEKTGF